MLPSRMNSTPRGMIMKRKISEAVLSVVLAVVATALWTAPVEAVNTGAPRIAPPVSHAFGKTYPEWFSTYWRWFYGTAQNPAQGVVGHVQLMPQPVGTQVGGTWTPIDPAVYVGALSINLRPGTPFVLPLLGLVGERYEGYPTVPDDDPAFYANATYSAKLTIDGKTIVSPANQAAYFLPVTFFDPIVEYPGGPTSYGSVAAIWFEGIGIVSPPLPVGVHVIHLDATLIVPSVFGVTYDNTWTVTVTPH